MLFASESAGFSKSRELTKVRFPVPGLNVKNDESAPPIIENETEAPKSTSRPATCLTNVTFSATVTASTAPPVIIGASLTSVIAIV